MNELKSKFHVIARNCISKIWNKQFLIFLFFLLLSSAFWIFQALNEVYEEDFEVKVEITNVPAGAIITTEAVPTIDMQLRDRGVTLFNYKYGFQFKPIKIDYNVYSNSSGHVRILTRELLKQISSQLASSTQIISAKPDTVEFFYNHGLHKRVPVILEGDVRTEKGYTVTRTTLSEDSVTVYAASSLLDNIKEARIKLDYLKNISNNTEMNLQINRVKGAKFIPDHINLNVDVERLVEKKIKVPIETRNFPANLKLLPIPQETEVIFQIAMNRYNEISHTDFSVIADFNDLPTYGNTRYPLRLTKTPSDAIKARLLPNQVEFIIEKVDETAQDSLSQEP